MTLPDPADVPLQPRSADCPVPMTAWQLRVWNDMVDRGTRLSEWRVCAASVRLVGPLDASLLQAAIEAVVQKHEPLRTRFGSVDGVARQLIDPTREHRLDVVDLTGVSRTKVEEEARNLARQFGEEKIDLNVGPLFQSRLLRLSSREHVLILALDHMVSDLISYDILNTEIWALYEQAAQGRTPALAPLPIQFADYAVWQQQTYDAWLQKHGLYWKQHLSGAPRLRLPVEESSTEVENPALARVVLPFGAQLSGKLRDVARRERALLPLVVLTAYAALISRWCNQRDFVLAFVSHGRHRQELENMIGFLANILYFRIEIGAEDNFLDVLKRVTLEFHSAYQHRDFDRVPDLVPECATEIYFNWISAHGSARLARQQPNTDAQIKIQAFPIQPFPSRAHTTFRFAGAFSDGAAGIALTLLHRTDLLGRRRMERFGNNLRLFAETFAERPLASVASVALAP